MMTSKPSLRRNALVTASYAPDLERCRILCESIDRYASGYETHYILVENRDLPLFRALEGGKRKVIGERDILPFWLKRFSDPTRKGASVWLSPFTKPLHGWHVQQLRRIALAAIAEEDALIYCDSDTAMIRAYDFSGFWRGDALRLYRQENGADHAQSDHKIWMHHAAEVFGDKAVAANRHNYVATFIAWRRDTVQAMCRAIEDRHGKSWVAAIGNTRKFSECTLYGAFADTVQGGAGHFIDEVNVCPMHWFEPAPTRAELAAFVAGLSPREIAVGVQSFVKLDPLMFRSAIGLERRRSDAA